MSPERTFHRVILVIALVITIAIVIRIDPKFGDEKPLVIMIGILTGTGLHEALLKIVEFMLNWLKPLKRLILQSSYVEGMWYGFYETTPGAPRFVIETIRQEWTALYINGRAYNERGEHHGAWSSLTANVDGKTGRLHSISSGNLATGHYESIVTFQLQGDPPDQMSGQIFDSATNPNAGRAWILLKKSPSPITDEQAFQESCKMYSSAKQMREMCEVPKINA